MNNSRKTYFSIQNESFIAAEKLTIHKMRMKFERNLDLQNFKWTVKYKIIGKEELYLSSVCLLNL